MAAHTRFIIVITAAFLTWAVSFSLLTMKDRNARKKQRQALVEQRERILGEIADLEFAREAEDLTETGYRSRSKALRNDLARVVERIQRSSGKKKTA
jgi:hypothetical protein